MTEEKYFPKLFRASTVESSLAQSPIGDFKSSLKKSLSVEVLDRHELDRAITQSLFENDLLLYYCSENCEGFVELIKDGTKVALQ